MTLAAEDGAGRLGRRSEVARAEENIAERGLRGARNPVEGKERGAQDVSAVRWRFHVLRRCPEGRVFMIGAGGKELH